MIDTSRLPYYCKTPDGILSKHLPHRPESDADVPYWYDMEPARTKAELCQWIANHTSLDKTRALDAEYLDAIYEDTLNDSYLICDPDDTTVVAVSMYYTGWHSWWWCKPLRSSDETEYWYQYFDNRRDEDA